MRFMLADAIVLAFFSTMLVVATAWVYRNFGDDE